MQIEDILTVDSGDYMFRMTSLTFLSLIIHFYGVDMICLLCRPVLDCSNGIYQELRNLRGESSFCTGNINSEYKIMIGRRLKQYDQLKETQSQLHSRIVPMCYLFVVSAHTFISIFYFLIMQNTFKTWMNSFSPLHSSLECSSDRFDDTSWQSIFDNRTEYGIIPYFWLSIIVVAQQGFFSISMVFMRFIFLWFSLKCRWYSFRPVCARNTRSFSYDSHENR